MIPASSPNEYTDRLGIVEPSEGGCGLPPGVMVARTLFRAGQGNVPVRLVNTNLTPVKLKMGSIIGKCTQVSAIKIQSDSEQKTNKPSIPEHLEDLIIRASQNLDKDRRNEVERLLHEYADVFSVGPDDMGRTHKVRHKIDTRSANPIKQAQGDFRWHNKVK